MATRLTRQALVLRQTLLFRRSTGRRFNHSASNHVHVNNTFSTNRSKVTSLAFSAGATIAIIAAAGFSLNQNQAQADAAATKVPTSTPDELSSKTTTSTPPSKPLPPSFESTEIVNWSGTHAVTTERFYQPETLEELKRIVEHAHETKQKIRPVGSALSPNGLPFNENGMICLSNMDNILSIDKKSKQVTVQAGARVSQVVDALRPHGLTLQNFASITEQQIGGFTQVSAHGTGLHIPPVDEQVVAIRIITPGSGELLLSANDGDPSLFHVARTSLGLMGVVAEVTFQCVDAHKLLETTTVLSRSEVARQHQSLLSNNRHLRYMWIPYTDDVIVVTCNPVKEGETEQTPNVPMPDRLKHVRALLKSHPNNKLTDTQIDELQFPSLRDELLALDPLDMSWIQKVNKAESEFWRKSQGVRIDWSDKILQFDCGGQQWVSEIAFPVPKLTEGVDGNVDVNYMFDLLKTVEDEKIPAPAPIEQRWSAPSRSPLSPASERPDKQVAPFYSWVGIIMYLPDEQVNPVQRQKITETFKAYKSICEQKLWPKVSAVEHWAKIEMPQNEKDQTLLQQRTAQKYPTEAFKAICSIFDPHGILRNELVETIFGPVPFP